MAAHVNAFFDKATSTFTYVVHDGDGGTAAIIDPVLDYDHKSGRTRTQSSDAVIAFVREHRLKVEWILETHAHADHLTGAELLKEALGGKVGIGSRIDVVQKTFKGLFNLEPSLAVDGSQFDHLFVDGEAFSIYKFRTMTDERGPDGELLPDAQRLTPLGKFLRKTSLDELPELYNILKGEMSLVGPRPLLLKYVPLYSPRQARRHEVLPGLTGWVAVNGRNTRSWEERFEQDVWYVENYGLGVDLYILWRTVAVVLSRENVDPVGLDMMPNFEGNKP